MTQVADERGFTLIELLVAMMTGVVVAGAALSFMLVSFDQQNASSSRSAAVTQGEVGLQQLTRDLRSAMYQTVTNTTYSVSVSTNAAAKTTSLTFYVPTSVSNGVTTANDNSGVQVTWTCPSSAQSSTYIGTCTRAVTGVGTKTLITGVQSATFTPYDSTGTQQSAPWTNPSTLDITLDLQDVSQSDTTQSHTVTGVANPIVLQTSVDLRNMP